jgi:hypothetical protein
MPFPLDAHVICPMMRMISRGRTHGKNTIIKLNHIQKKHVKN